MASVTRFQAWMLLFLALFHGRVFADVDARIITCTPGPARDGARCLSRQGGSFYSSYCSSVLALTASTVEKETTVTELVDREVTREATDEA